MPPAGRTQKRRARVASHGRGTWLTVGPAGTKRRLYRGCVMWCGQRPSAAPLPEPLPRVWPAASVLFVVGPEGMVEHVMSIGAANDAAMPALVGNITQALTEVGRAGDGPPLRVSLALLAGNPAVPANMLATVFETGLVSPHPTKPEEWSLRSNCIRVSQRWTAVRDAHWSFVRTGEPASPLSDTWRRADDPFRWEELVDDDGIPVGVKVTRDRALTAARVLHATFREPLPLPLPAAWGRNTGTKLALIDMPALLPAVCCAWLKHARDVWPQERVGVVTFVRGLPFPGALHASEVCVEWVCEQSVIMVLNCEAADGTLPTLLTTAAALTGARRPTLLLVGSASTPSPAARIGALPRGFFASLLTDLSSAVVVSDPGASETAMPVIQVVDGTSVPRVVHVGRTLSVGSGILTGLGPDAAAAAGLYGGTGSRSAPPFKSRGALLRLTYTTMAELLSTYGALRRVVGHTHVAVVFLKQPAELVKEFTDKIAAVYPTRLWLDVALGDTFHFSGAERVYTSGSPAGVRGNFLALVPGVVFEELPPLRVRALLVVGRLQQLDRAAALASHNLVLYETL